MELGWGQGRRGQRTRSQHIGGPQGSRAEGEGRAQHREADDTAPKSARWVRTRWSPGTGVVPTPWPVAVLPGVPGLGGPGPHPSPGAQALCFLRTSWNLGLRSSPGSGLSRPAPTEGPGGEGLRARLLRAPVPMGGNCPEPGRDRWEAGPSGAWGAGVPAAWAPSSRAVGLTASCAPGGPSASVFDLETITRLLLRPGVLPVFLIRVVCAFPFGESRPPAAGACTATIGPRHCRCRCPVSCAPACLSPSPAGHIPRERDGPGRQSCVPGALPSAAAPKPGRSHGARSRRRLGSGSSRERPRAGGGGQGADSTRPTPASGHPRRRQ